jgi:hypothetical protein
MSLRYLEVEVTSKGALKSKSSIKSCEGARLPGCLGDTIYRNRYLRAEPQVRIHKSVTRRVLTHATAATAVTCIAKQIVDLQERTSQGKLSGMQERVV